MTISTRVDQALAEDAERCAAEVGLKVSDLVRVGLSKVCLDIHRTGKLSVTVTPPRSKPREIARCRNPEVAA